MDSEEAKAEQKAMSIELNRAILDYRAMYSKLQSDPHDAYLKVETKRMKEHIHTVAMKQKERFAALRVDAGCKAGNAAETAKAFAKDATTTDNQKTQDIKEGMSQTVCPPRDTEQTIGDKQTSTKRVGRKCLLPRIMGSEKKVLDEKVTSQVTEKKKAVKPTKSKMVPNPVVKVTKAVKVIQAKRQRTPKYEENLAKKRKMVSDAASLAIFHHFMEVNKNNICNAVEPLQELVCKSMVANVEGDSINHEKTDSANADGSSAFDPSICSKDTFLLALDLISVEVLRERSGQKEQKRATRQKKSTANHSQFVYGDWDDAKKKKKKEAQVSKKMPVTCPVKESESESDVETSSRSILIPRRKKCIRICKELQPKSTLSGVERGPLNLAQPDATLPALGQSVLKRKKGALTSKQVPLASPKQPDSEALTEIMLLPKVAMPKKKSIGKPAVPTSSAKWCDSSSSSPEVLSTPIEVEAARRNFHSLLSQKAPPKSVLYVKKQKPSILQRSKSEQRIIVGKLASFDPLTPLLIHVPKYMEYLPNGEPQRHVPSILRSPGVTRRMAKEADMFEAAAAQPFLGLQPDLSALSLTIPGLPPSLTIQRISEQKSAPMCCMCHKPGGGIPNDSLDYTREPLRACKECTSVYHSSCCASTSTSTSTEHLLCPHCTMLAKIPRNILLSAENSYVKGAVD